MSINWLKNRFTDLKYFNWLFGNWNRLKGGKYSLTSFFKYWFLYPIPRLVLGRDKALDISQKIINDFIGGNLIIPLPIAGPEVYYVGIRDSGDFDAFREICIENHYNFFKVKPGMTVVDIGAHIGTFTLLASKRAGNKGRVIAVEAELKNFDQLKKNLEINEIKNVIPVNIALSDFNGQKDFYITKGSGCHSFSANAGQEVINKIKTGVKSLDTLIKELNIEKIDLIKIDTEGAELEILKGARETLIKNPEMKMVIAAYHYPKEILEVVDYLKKLNFSSRILPGVFSLVVVE